MRVTRCYLPGSWREGSETELPRAQSDHLIKVLRLRADDSVQVFDGEGGAWQATLVSGARRGYRLRIGGELAAEPLPGLPLTLVQAVARSDKMDWIVQKATELGVFAIQPLITEHSVVRMDAAQAARKTVHWQAIAAAACEQCGRSRLPRVAQPIELQQLANKMARPAGLLWVLDPGAGIGLSSAAQGIAAWQPPPAGIALLVGPEGGLSETEMQQLIQQGARPLGLGRRVLRTETAALAALTLIQGALGELGN
jgi:16S rRNA (uracil1498-N3)-methyltransferase